MQLNGNEFSQLIADVEKEFGAYLAKAESSNVAASGVQALSKSDEEGKEEPKEEEKEEESKPEHKPEMKDEESKPEHKEEAKEEEKTPEHKLEEGKEGEKEGHGYDEEDMNHMHEMYGSMDKHELKAHHDSVRAALDKCMGMEKEEAPMEMAAKPAAAPMAKSEISIDFPVATKELELIKSELAAEKAKSDELKKSFDIVNQVLLKLVKKGAPQGKAVTAVDTLSKSESANVSLTPVQITEALTRKAKDATLSKSDREAINAYYMSNTSIQTISHLLK